MYVWLGGLSEAGVPFGKLGAGRKVLLLLNILHDLGVLLYRYFPDIKCLGSCRTFSMDRRSSGLGLGCWAWHSWNASMKPDSSSSSQA